MYMLHFYVCVLQVKVKQLLEWAKLDERTVLSAFLDQLDSSPAEMATLGGEQNACCTCFKCCKCTRVKLHTRSSNV
jgi:hypothetical protein